MRAWFVGFFLLLLAACSAQVGAPVERTPQGFLPWSNAVAPYRLRPGDQLDVKFLYNPELSDRVLIGPDGRFAMSLIGVVKAEGLTVDQLHDDLRRRFAKILRRPDVAVIIREYAPQKILVGGEVRDPGIHTLPGRIGVLEGVMLAGGFRETARIDRVVLLRRGPDDKPMLKVVDLDGMLSGNPHQSVDVPLRPFDVIYVPRSSIAEVDLWIDQYINRAIPFSRGFSYTINRNGGGQ
jgi:protein involved in polysaccharide export with SLBB domain